MYITVFLSTHTSVCGATPRFWPLGRKGLHVGEKCFERGYPGSGGLVLGARGLRGWGLGARGTLGLSLVGSPDAWLKAPEAWLEAPEAWLEAPEA